MSANVWLPIETAPKDQTEILAWDGFSIQCVTWRNGRWVTTWDFDEDYEECGPAIFWQPIPLPPTTDTVNG